jgi:hypothetical protein
MKRELPVRFREGLGVRLPRATRLVLGFACEGDARRVLEVLPKRFAKYGLTLHPDKTRLLPFQRPPYQPSRTRPPGQARPGTFDFLGFTHFWERSRQGNWVVKRKTASRRLSRALRTIAQWCRLHRHRPLAEQHQTLRQKLRGHYAYYGITGNYSGVRRFQLAVLRLWRKWLARRRRRGFLSWERFLRLLDHYVLPAAEVVHSVYRRVSKAVT